MGPAIYDELGEDEFLALEIQWDIMVGQWEVEESERIEREHEEAEATR